jgi:TRAP-type C4-dicarboxylate transport system permease small subunit
MFTKAAKYMNKVISYPSNLLAGSAMVGIVFVVLAVSADVFMRYAFHKPLFGTWDLCTLAFCLIVWGPMAMAALKGSHIALTYLVDKLPRLPRLGLDLIVTLVTSATLGVLSWRLVLNAMVLGANQTRTAVLTIPLEPFGYFAAFASAILALAFLVRVPEIVGKIRKEPEAVRKTQEELEAVGKIEKMKGSSV